MADVQVVYLRDMLPVYKVEPIPDFSIPSVRIKGKRYDTAATVLLNGVECPAFLLISNAELVAEIPKAVLGDMITTIAVLASKMTDSKKALLSFRMGGHTTRVSGVQRLVQRFVLMLLTDPGSDVYQPQAGGGLMSLIGQNANLLLSGGIERCITKTSDDLRKVQKDRPPDERLSMAAVAGMDFDARTTAMAVRIIITSAAGNSATANLVL